MLALVLCLAGVAFGQYAPSLYQSLADSYHQPAPVYKIVQPAPVYNTVQPAPEYKTVQPVGIPTSSSFPGRPYQVGQPLLEGGDLSPVQQDQTKPYLTPNKLESGGNLSPDQLEIPRNTQIKLQDDRLQYSQGFSDDSTGTQVREQGSLLSTNEGWEYVIAKKGSYSYTSPEGKLISVKYIADHNGFRILP